MEWQDAFNLLVLVTGAMGGWILGRISKTLDRLDEDMRKLPTTYVTRKDFREDMTAAKEDFREAVNDVKVVLVRIESKLDLKADK